MVTKEQLLAQLEEIRDVLTTIIEGRLVVTGAVTDLWHKTNLLSRAVAALPEEPTPAPVPTPEPAPTPAPVPEPEPTPSPEPEPAPIPEPTVPAEPTPAPGFYVPDLSRFRSASAIRMDRFPAFKRLTEADCHWIIDTVAAGGKAISTRGLGSIPTNGSNVAGLCYRASRAAGHHGTIVIGVRDSGGTAYVGGKWGIDAGHSVVARNEPGVDVAFVGLTDHADMTISWGKDRDIAIPVNRLQIQMMGLVGTDDAMMIRAGEVDTLILDDYWLINRLGKHYEQGIHYKVAHKLVKKGLKWRGKTPQDPGVLLAEHSDYDKKIVNEGIRFLIDCDGIGGNRSGITQIRPGTDEDDFAVVPSGQTVIMDCRSHGHGFTHGTTPETANGGGCISVWSSPNDSVFILGNRITDTRYGALMVGGQGWSAFPGMGHIDRNFYGNSGYPIKHLVVEGNHFENDRGDRATVSISNTEIVDWYPDNTFGARGSISIDNGWAMVKSVPTRESAARCKKVNFFGGRPPVRITRGVQRGADAEVPLTQADIDAMIRPL